jgi:hypothetical protein
MCIEVVFSYSVEVCADTYSLTNLYELFILCYVHRNGKRTLW